MTTNSNLVEAHVSLVACQHGRVSIPTSLGQVSAKNEGHGWRITRKPVPLSNQQALALVQDAILKAPLPTQAYSSVFTWSGTVHL